MKEKFEEETRGQGDKGTRGQGDKETRRQGDKETRGQGDKGTIKYILLSSPSSPSLPIEFKCTKAYH